jgi:hypothetical protein
VKILNPKIHGYLDYGVVILFLAAPTIFGSTGIPAIIAYTLAVVHLLVTAITAFPLGIVQLLPLQFHGAIELVVAFTLIALPWILGFVANLAARNFYIAVGVLIFAVWLVTDYKAIAIKKTPERS